MTDITLIHTEAQYDAALAEYEGFFDNEPQADSPEADRFVLLGMVIARYEEETAASLEASPAEVIRGVMASTGRTQSDFAALLGSRSRASEILSGRRELTLSQIRLVSKAWRIPAAALIGEAA